MGIYTNCGVIGMDIDLLEHIVSLVPFTYFLVNTADTSSPTIMDTNRSHKNLIGMTISGLPDRVLNEHEIFKVDPNMWRDILQKATTGCPSSESFRYHVTIINRTYRITANPLQPQYEGMLIIIDDITLDKNELTRLTEFRQGTFDYSLTPETQPERVSQRNVSLEKILFNLTAELFKSDIHDFDTILERTLKTLGRFSGSDRAYIFLYANDTKTMSNTHEWCMPRIPSEKKRLQHLPMELFPNCIQSLRQEEEIFIHSGSKLQHPWLQEWKLLQSQEIKSVLVKPIIKNGVHFGFIGFDSVMQSMEWSSDERQQLRIFVDTIGEVFARSNIDKRIDGTAEKTETLAKEKNQTNNRMHLFHAKMIHDIRNSINSIMGIDRILLSTALSPQQLHYAKIIYASSEFLLNLVQDMLDYSRLEQGNIKIKYTRFSLKQVIKQCTDLFSILAEDKGLAISDDSSPALPENLMGDPLRIAQILSNLLSNAVKYTDQGRIEVKTRILEISNTGLVVRIAVNDTGRGIDSINIQRIFLPYFKQEDLNPTVAESTGLGLSIVKYLCDAMHGSISVTSKLGIGSSFICTLPLSFAHDHTHCDLESALMSLPTDSHILIANRSDTNDPLVQSFISSGACVTICDTRNELKDFVYTKTGHVPVPVVFVNAQLYEEKSIALLRHNQQTVFSKKPLIFIIEKKFTRSMLRKFQQNEDIDGFFTLPIAIPVLHEQLLAKLDMLPLHLEDAMVENLGILKNMHVLVVEDIFVNQEIILHQLKRIGIKTRIAGNGKEALEILKSEDFDLILMDVWMPILDGIETTRRIRALPDKKKSKVPIVAMTANTLETEKAVCLDAGYDEFITKPITPCELFGVLIQFITPPQASNNTIKQLSALSTTVYDSDDRFAIDTEKALSLLGGNERLFHTMIEQFSSEFGTIREDFASQEDNVNNLIVLVHGIRSLAGNLGAIGLNAIALRLETALEEKDTPAYEVLKPQFFHAMDETLSVFSQLLQNRSKRNTSSETLDYRPVQNFPNLLDELKKQLEIGNVNKIHTLAVQIQKDNILQNQQSIFQTLLSAIDSFEYERASVLVSGLIGTTSNKKSIHHEKNPDN